MQPRQQVTPSRSAAGLCDGLESPSQPSSPRGASCHRRLTSRLTSRLSPSQHSVLQPRLAAGLCVESASHSQRAAISFASISLPFSSIISYIILLVVGDESCDILFVVLLHLSHRSNTLEGLPCGPSRSILCDAWPDDYAHSPRAPLFMAQAFSFSRNESFEKYSTSTTWWRSAFSSC